MSMMSEIHALRAQIEAHARSRPTVDADAPTIAAPNAPTSDERRDRPDVETLLKLMNETLDEFAHELDRFPRLTALAALGIGLAAGVVVGRQLR